MRMMTMRIQTMVMLKGLLLTGVFRRRGTRRVFSPSAALRTRPPRHQTATLIQTAGRLRGSLWVHDAHLEPRNASPGSLSGRGTDKEPGLADEQADRGARFRPGT